jgi:hypothetical protein
MKTPKEEKEKKRNKGQGSKSKQVKNPKEVASRKEENH